MILIPKYCGTCSGANNAIDKALTATKIYPNKKIVIYKEILHNQRVIDDLEKQNISCINNLNTANENNIVIIRAHGEGKNTYDFLNSKKIKYIDATCPNVSRIHEIINDKYELGYSIIIIGKKISNEKFHPEIEGSNGWCDNNAVIVDSIEDIDNISNLNKNVLIICQTTANEAKVIKYATIIKEKFKDNNIEFINTICKATKNIQTSSMKVAKQADIMFVIGGKNSSNTNELYKKCNQFCKSIMVSTKEELVESLKDNIINNETIIGITGGTSTPQYEIDEYKKIIEQYQNQL